MSHQYTNDNINTSIMNINLLPKDFYAAFGEDYYLLSETNWEEDVCIEGNFFGQLFIAEGVKSILDCSAGPGTQALGLASQGFQVTASDVSCFLLAELQASARARGLSIPCFEADMRDLHAVVPGTYDAVLTAGNALPHLGSMSEVGKALNSMRVKLSERGVLVLALRDYRDELKHHYHQSFNHVRGTPPHRRWFMDLRDYTGGLLNQTFLVLQETLGGWSISKQISTELYPIRVEELQRMLEDYGFVHRLVTDYRWGIVIVARLAS